MSSQARSIVKGWAKAMGYHRAKPKPTIVNGEVVMSTNGHIISPEGTDTGISQYPRKLNLELSVKTKDKLPPRGRRRTLKNNWRSGR